MTRYSALPLATKYWKPGEDYLNEIVEATKKRIRDGDFVVVSEKALSIALNNIVDESLVVPDLSAKLIVIFWMRAFWGYFLGTFCNFGPRLLLRLRNYPLIVGSRHKKLVLQHAGLLQALMFGSEGGIDGSNLPLSLVSLPLNETGKLAIEIQRHILNTISKRVTVIIVDTDKTYTLRNLHFTPRPKPIKGIYSRGGLCLYLAGRIFRLKRRPTPLAIGGENLSVEDALRISKVADKARGPGSGATVWDMAARFKVEVSDVTWRMLETIKHKPIVIVRKEN